MSLSTDVASDFSPPMIFMAGWMARKTKLHTTAATTAQRTDTMRRTRNGQELRTARRKVLMGEGFNTICPFWAIRVVGPFGVSSKRERETSLAQDRIQYRSAARNRYLSAAYPVLLRFLMALP